MSQENVEIVRSAYDRLNRMDAEGLIELCDPGFTMDMTGRVFNPDVYEGAEGVRRFVSGVADAWEAYRWEVEDTRSEGDRVVALLHCHGTGRDGLTVDWRVGWLWELREGRLLSVRFFRERSDALEAL